MGPENCSTIAPVALQTMDSKYFQPVKNTLNTWGLQGTQVATYKNFQKLWKVDCARPFSNFALSWQKFHRADTRSTAAGEGEPTCLNQWGWETWRIQVPHPESRAAQRAEARAFSHCLQRWELCFTMKRRPFSLSCAGCWNETSHIHTLTVWTPKIGALVFLFQAFEKDSKCSFSSRCSCESD